MSARSLQTAEVNDAVVQPDGSYVLVGAAGVESPYSSATALSLSRHSADGAADPSFGRAGFVTTALGDGASANAIALQPDGKIVVAGSVRTGSAIKGVLARYDADGTLDASFGTGGTVTGLPAMGTAVALQPDGKIVVATQDGQLCASVLTITRYDVDGSPDTAFGNDGVATANLGEDACTSEDSVLVQSNGKVIVAGERSGKLAIVRFNGSGSLDTSYGSSGVATINLGAAYAIASSRVRSLLQPNGKLIVATSGIDGFAVVRLAQDGSLDGSFGSGGVAAVAQLVLTRAIGLQADGKIVFAGGDLAGTPSASNPGVLARFNPDGSLDSSFGTAGTAQLDFGFGGMAPAVVAPDSSGGFVVMGGATACVASDESCIVTFSANALARFTSAGLPDMSFGDDGQVVASPLGNVVTGARNSHPKAAIAQPDGSVIVTGDSYAYDTHPYPGGSGFALAKYTRDGRIDSRFGDGGFVATSLVSDPSTLPTTATTALRQANGKIVVVGGARSSVSGRVRFAVARYLPDGSLDPVFGTGGIATTPFSDQRETVAGAVLEGDGKIVVGGNVGGRATLVRYRGNGSLDRSFGGDGVVALAGARSVKTLRAVGLSRNGRILVAGMRGVAGPFSGAMVELDADGTRNPSFGGPRGVASVPVGRRGDVSAILMSADGRPLVLGRTSSRSIALFRYGANGKRDRLFNRRAAALRDVPGIGGSVLAGTFQGRRGKLVLAGTNSDHFALVRVRRNGTIDRSFGAQGVEISKVFGRLKAVTAGPGRILAAGDASFENANGSNRQTFAAVAAFHP